jgi:ring-1,2-phenylacetyl-CoA epoxidase subunit PaaE
MICQLRINTLILNSFISCAFAPLRANFIAYITDMPVHNITPLNIKSIIPETADTRSFVLENEMGSQISYEPGQFLTFVFTKPGGEQERRNYSIASSSVWGEPLQITVKRIANGAYSRWLVDHAKEGNTLLTTGVSGFFTLPDDIPKYSQLIFFAAGSGITPVFSLIKTVLHLHKTISITLIYSNASPATTIFYDALIKLQDLYPGKLDIEFLFSASTVFPKKRLNMGIVESVARQYFSQPGKETLVYLCGPVDYMRFITIVLRTEGVPDNAIRKEIFHIEKPVIKQLPPDILRHTVFTQLAQERYEFTSLYPATILQSAKALGIPLPYSCEAGQCGTCAATCISGTVWMSHNDVLMDDEIAKGRVLTCTGYAVGGDVVLKYPM